MGTNVTTNHRFCVDARIGMYAERAATGVDWVEGHLGKCSAGWELSVHRARLRAMSMRRLPTVRMHARGSAACGLGAPHDSIKTARQRVMQFSIAC